MPACATRQPVTGDELPAVARTRATSNISQLRLLHSTSNADWLKIPDKWGPFGDGQAPPRSHGMRNPRAVNMMDEGNYSWCAVGAHPPLSQSSHQHYGPGMFWAP